MRYRHVYVEAVTTVVPPDVVTSTDIEDKLAAVYERLRLPEGRLELMSGIRERRFFPPGTRPGEISAIAARKAIEQSGLDRRHFGALIHGSVCRDQMEPATANGVHHHAQLPQACQVFDVSNACLGLLNGMILLANMIELGHVRAGVVVGTEIGRPLVEGTIDSLLADPNLSRKQLKGEFASLTIGSGSAAIVMCDERLTQTGNRLVGGLYRADTASHELCAGGVESATHGDDRPRMQTDSEALLHAGVGLAKELWPFFLGTLEWNADDIDKVCTHQVGRAHRKLLLDELGIPLEKDFPTVERFGNTGSTALPIAWAEGIQNGHITPGDRLALLGIGSGLNALMLGVEWNAAR